MLILVVEDDDNALDLIRQAILLHNAQSEVIEATQGEDVLELCQTRKPDLVILDLALPGINGWEVLDMLRANADTSNIPVAALTGYHSPSVEDDAITAGFNAYFSKPIDILNFGAAVTELIK